MLIRLSTSALALALAAGPALALTPEEVWTGWNDQYTRMGYTVTEGARDLAGETLTVRDVVLTTETEGNKTTVTVPQVVLQAAGDGSVRSTFTDTIPVKVETVDAEGQPLLIDLSVTSQGLEVTTTGEGVARSDRTVAQTVTIAVDKVDVAGDATDAVNPGSVTATNVVSETSTQDGLSYASTGTVEKTDFVVDVTDEDGGTFKTGGSIAAIKLDGTATVPQGGTSEIMADVSAALRAGLAFKGTVTLGASNADFAFTTPQTAEAPASDTTGTTTASGGELTLSFDANGAGYAGKTNGLKADVTGGGMPVPISYSLDEGRFDFLIPLLKTDAPAPFRISYGITNLTLADSVWGLFDPQSKLPRTPANLDLNVSGLAKVNVDLLDEEAMTASGSPDPATDPAADPANPAEPADPTATPDAPADGVDTAANSPMPFEPTEMKVNRIYLDAVGAKLDGTGDFKVVDGNFSAPEGTMNLRMEGIDGLITVLTEMGLVPQEQVSGIRMMLAMFAKPGEGADTLVSDLEFRADGSVFANGQQIK